MSSCGRHSCSEALQMQKLGADFCHCLTPGQRVIPQGWLALSSSGMHLCQICWAWWRISYWCLQRWYKLGPFHILSFDVYLSNYSCLDLFWADVIFLFFFIFYLCTFQMWLVSTLSTNVEDFTLNSHCPVNHPSPWYFVFLVYYTPFSSSL